ncbi:MAG: OsmC family protein [Archangium sp.]|nr:OsmC family protein [Archangium sp.]
MHVHTAQVSWRRGSAPFTDGKYARAHTWRFDGGVEVLASASPQRVPVPMSLEAAVDPEEALVAAVSSCHLLWFLYFASKAGLCVDGYDDDAVGELARDERGKTWLSTFILRPRVTWSGVAPTAEVEAALHHQAHEACDIANSLRGTVRVEPRCATGER